MSEDIGIIRRVRGGDVRSFSIIVEKYHRRLLNFIYRLVGDQSIVEDIGQEVFLSAYEFYSDVSDGSESAKHFPDRSHHGSISATSIEAFGQNMGETVSSERRIFSDS